MEVTVSSIMQKIMDEVDGLTLDQCIDIRNILEIEFSDVTIKKNTYELALVNNNDKYLREYVASLKLSGKSDKTIIQYVNTIKNMLEVIRKDVIDITKKDLNRYYAEYKMTHDISNTTLLNLQRYISPFFKFLAREEYIPIDPTQFIEPPKIKIPDIDPFTGEELEIIREQSMLVQPSCSVRNRALIEFLISTGCRVTEVANCKISDIDFEKKSVLVTGKGNKDRIVYFTGGTLKYLKDYLLSREDGQDCLFYSHRTNSSMTKGSIESFCRKLCGENIRCNPHRFRHTFAQICIDRGMPVEDLSHLMGHENIDTTMRYYKRNTSKLESAYKKYVS